MDASNIESFGAVAVESANAMPAPTWHRLHVNSEKVALPEGLEISSDIEFEINGIELGELDAFNSALSAFQQKLDARNEGNVDTRAVAVAAVGDASPENLDIPALSSYQRKAVLEELENNVSNSFETGMGGEAYAYLESVSDGHLVLAASENAVSSATVRISAKDGIANAACVDVIAAPHSKVSLTISYEGISGGSGFAGCGLRVFAGVGSEVMVDSIQALDGSWTVFDDSGYVLDDNAHVIVTHRVLGADSASTGLSADLRGDQSRIDVATRYLGIGHQERDFNYSIKQRGRSTESNLDANGVLSGESKKTLRGTIDFVHGCKGSTGNERETVLLADKNVVNKTVPVILCDEDDVMGNHGATIGHVRPEQHFYLSCRGLSDKAIESLFAVAALEEAHMAFEDERIKNGIAQFASTQGIDAENFDDPKGECD